MFIAFVMKGVGEIDWIKSFETETEANTFGIQISSYDELDPEMDDPLHWEKYDPPAVILFEADDESALETGKYTRPMAIYHRGERYECVLQQKPV